MAEYYRQFAFVSSVLAGFAFTFYATLLAINRPHRAVSWAALLTVTASICFLTVTLGTTFAVTHVAGIEDRASLPPLLRQQPMGQAARLAAVRLAGGHAAVKRA